MDKNAELAELLGWTRITPTGFNLLGGLKFDVYVDKEGEQKCLCGMFRPDADLNAFHTHVIPVLKERGLMKKWVEQVMDAASKQYAIVGGRIPNVVKGGLYMAMASPDTLTDAAIAVMKGQDDE